jgi:hypothetical protein
MKNIKLSFFLLLFPFISIAQTIKFEGVVQDSLKKPLEMANVMAINLDTKAMDGYSITNDKGKFLISLKPNTTYSVKVSFIGFKSRELSIVTSNENITKAIELKEGGIELEGVEIVQEMPVSIVGDKIVYNADSFTSGTERKLEDVLKKLPGVEVNKDGEVKVEGKTVQKLMVDGKEFFDGDTKLGIKNIPADAIDKIEVLRNYNDVGALKGVENNEENVAMNIKLKKGKKNFWFGDVSAGYGVGRNDSRYIFNPKLFYYSPKYSINLISNFNNVGELPFTIQDYFKLNGGFRNLNQKGGSSLNISSNAVGLSFLRNNQAKEIISKFGATNFTYNITKTWTLSGFAIFQSSINDLETISSSTIVASGAQTNTTQTNRQQSDLGIAKFSSSFKPNTKLQFDYDFLTRVSNQTEASNSARQAIVNSVSDFETITTQRKQKPFSFNQNMSLFYTPNDKHIFAFETQHLYQDEDPFYNANLRTQPFALAGYVTGQNRNSIDQSRFLKTNKVDSKLDYYYMVTKKSNFNVTLGNTYSYQNFNTALFQNLDNGNQNALTAPENNNRSTFSFNDAFLGLHYKILAGKFTLTPGVTFHTYNTNTDQLGASFRQTIQQVLPDFFALYQIKKSETLSYTFRVANNFVDITRLAEGRIFSGLNSLSIGNREIQNATVQSHKLQYFKYNLFNFENISGNINYSRRIDDIKTNAIFNGINQISRPFNSPFVDETLSGRGSYGRSFTRNYKASVDFNLNWSKFYNIQNSVVAVAENFSQNYTLRTSTNYKNLPNLEVGYTIGIQQFNANISTFYTETPFAKLDYFFLDSFSFVTEYEFNHFYNANRSADNEYDFLSASLSYQKKDSHWEFRASATNLLNTGSLNDANFNQFVISSSQYTVQPRYVLLNVKYNL